MKTTEDTCLMILNFQKWIKKKIKNSKETF
jgi:hypothetical protein